MEITDLRVTKLEVPMDEPKVVSKGRGFESRPAAIVEVETDAGITGVGEGVGPNPYMIETAVEEMHADDLVGEDPRDVERHWRTMVEGGTYWDQKGAAVSAASGIDIALWDILGKHHDAPLYRLLGGDCRGDGRVQAYASDLFWTDPGTMAERAADYVERGFPAVKTHLGNGVEADRERVAAIREAIGDAELMVDVNCAYDRQAALRAGRMLEEHGAYWYEEPLDPYDVEGLAELRAKLDVPIATGENEFTRWGFRRLFEAGAVDYAMPDLMRCGGITESRKIASLAGAFDVTATPHNFSTGVGLAATLQLMAATPETEWLEFDTTGYELYDPLVVGGIDVDSEGRVAVPDAPGVGAQLPDGVIEQYGIE